MLLKRLEQWDQASFQRLFRRSRSLQARQISLWLSKTADGPLYLVFALVLLSSGSSDAYTVNGLLLVAFAVELPLYLVLKNSIKRARPADALAAFINAHIIPSDRFSLPSGHTAGAFVFSTVIALYFPLWWPLALLWAILIGVSRIMLGVHFPLDVLAGAILGASSTLAAYTILN